MRFSLSLILSLALSLSAQAKKPPITAAAFAPDGKSIVIGSQSGLELRSWPDLKVSKKIKTALDHVHALKFSSDGRLLAVAGGSPAASGLVEVLQWPEGTLQQRIKAHSDVAYSVDWHPEGRELTTASADRTCAVCDAKTGKVLRRFQGHSRPVLDVCYLRTKDHIVSTGLDQSLRLWSTATVKQVRSLDNHVNAVSALALRPNNDPDVLPLVASISRDRTLRLWQPTIGRMVRFFRLPSIPLQVVWSSDGSVLFVSSRDGTVRQIDPDTLKIVQEKKLLAGWAYVLMLSPSGKSLFVGGADGEMKRMVIKN